MYLIWWCGEVQSEANIKFWVSDARKPISMPHWFIVDSPFLLNCPLTWCRNSGCHNWPPATHLPKPKIYSILGDKGFWKWYECKTSLKTCLNKNWSNSFCCEIPKKIVIVATWRIELWFIPKWITFFIGALCFLESIEIVAWHALLAAAASPWIHSMIC